ncbi:MAG: AAA family ATPase [Verrucomicrobia bacterium]|nr:AAA family ATPase [Verrucomicrobiota bacterium]
MAKLIAVTGKGGTGKTTVAALMVRHLRAHTAGPVLALDADPDANLGTVLGIPIGKTIGDLREETAEQINNLPAGLSKAHYIQAGLHEIIVELPKVDLITMGRSEGPGCYCYLNSLLRRFGEDLHDTYPWIVVDNEAGLEHLSRRTTSRIDHLIVVVNGSMLAVDCARRITELVADMKNEVKQKHFLINGVRDDRVAAIRQKLEALGLNYLGDLPRDEALENQVFEGRSLFDLDDGSPAVLKMNEIMKKLMED